jgi:hypothetical protein
VGEQQEANLAVTADGSWQAGNQTDETRAVHCWIAASVSPSRRRRSSWEAAIA